MDEIIYTPLTFNYIDTLNNLKAKGSCNRKTKNGINYLYNDFATFDIETTSVYPKNKSEDFEPYAFMYIWQFYIDGKIIIGRTWEEFITFIDNLTIALETDAELHLVVYVHNLPFEFQFMRNFLEFSDVFCTDKNKPLRAITTNGIEFRCSYKLSNMSLDKFILNCPTAQHHKLSGENFDYSKFRTPITELTDYELQYSINDVIGLYEALEWQLKSNDDNLATIPFTSTGYVRREARKAMQSNKKNIYNIRDARLYPYTYTLLKTARRGGNAHCNPYYSMEIFEGLKSKDMSSAYPAVMLQCKFPMKGFLRRNPQQLESLILDQKHALIIDLTFIGLQIKTLNTVPYIPKAKCIELSQIRSDNGRVLSAKRAGMVITDIDYNIIKNQYTWEDIEIRYVFSSVYDYLPNEYRSYIFERYKLKCDLKGSDEYLYNKEKNKINALFGMMLTDIVNHDIIYHENSTEPYTIEIPDLAETLSKYYSSRSVFLSYQWGVWVTAHCRNRLQKAIDGLGSDMVYCDTDSTKYFDKNNLHDGLFKKLNSEIREETLKCGFNTHYTRPDGKSFDLGLWEDDGEYEEFVSMGSKKYGYVEHGNLHITVAGLSKSKGANYIEKHGGLKCFRNGFVIPESNSGRTTAHFNNVAKPYYITVNDPQQKKKVRILNGSSIAIRSVEYTFGITDDYEELIQSLKSVIY